jgi:hypothetical protein
MILSNLVMSFVIGYEVDISINDDEYNEFCHYYMSFLMVLLVVFVIIDLAIFSTIRSAKNRMIFVIDQENRMISNQILWDLQQHSSVCEAIVEDSD